MDLSLLDAAEIRGSKIYKPVSQDRSYDNNEGQGQKIILQNCNVKYFEIQNKAKYPDYLERADDLI